MEGASDSKKIIGPFSVYPTQLKVSKGKDNMLYVDFLPTTQGYFE